MGPFAFSITNAGCPACGLSSLCQVTGFGGGHKVRCPRCGDFSISKIAAHEISLWSKKQKANLCGWIRENPECSIDDPRLEALGELRNLTVGEKAEKLLEHLADSFPKPGEKIYVIENDFMDLKLQAIGRCEDHDELDFFLRQYLDNEKKFLSFYNQSYQISPTGWAYIDSNRQANPNSQIGFIAMWFSDSVKGAWLAIDKGIYTAGYKPFRVDQKQHNNKIDDEIIAGIRGSKFLVADLTDHRGGVYYEAGFAQGLGLEVIWLCRKSDLEKMHFDIRQYNCIVWEPEKLEDLTKALKVRIEARFGHGPINEGAGV